MQQFIHDIRRVGAIAIDVAIPTGPLGHITAGNFERPARLAGTFARLAATVNMPMFFILAGLDLPAGQEGEQPADTLHVEADLLDHPLNHSYSFDIGQ